MTEHAGGVASAAAASASRESTQPRTLMNLPRDVMNRILEYLLKVEDVEERTSCGIRKYDFHVSILRTCKDLHLAGASIFRLNHFILLSATNKKISELLVTHDVPNWPEKHRLIKFKDYHVRIHVASKDWKTPEAGSFLLMCSADINSLVIALRESVIMMQPKFKLKIQINSVAGTSLSLRHQRALLTPFTRLRGFQQKCSITGADAVLSNDVCAKVSSNIHWKRAQLVNHIEVLKFIQNLADNAVRGGYLIRANQLYENFSEFCYTTRKTVQLATTLGAWNIAHVLIAHHLHAEYHVTATGLALAAQDKTPHTLKTIMSRQHMAYPKSRALEETIQLQQRGLTRLFLGDLPGARGSFVLADKLNPNTKLSKIFHQATSTLQPIQAHVVLLRRLARDLVPLLPPLTQTIISEHTSIGKIDVVASLDQELYDLQTLGYPDDTQPVTRLFEQKQGFSVIAGKEVNKPFDKRARDKALAPILTRFAECNRQGVNRPDHEVGVTLELEKAELEQHDIPLQSSQGLSDLLGAATFSFQMGLGPDGQPSFTIPAPGGGFVPSPDQINAFLAHIGVIGGGGANAGGAGGSTTGSTNAAGDSLTPSILDSMAQNAMATLAPGASTNGAAGGAFGPITAQDIASLVAQTVSNIGNGASWGESGGGGSSPGTS